MFTGIVEELGTVHAVEDLGAAVRLTVRADTVLSDVSSGDSIAVNGCCLTVAATAATDPGGAVDLWTADVMAETLDRTGLAGLEAGDPVNLERAVTATTRLGGHLVQGHVDAVGEVLARTPSGHRPSPRWEVVEIAMPADLGRYLVEKGSITVDGVSLTLVEVGADRFTVSLIPETLARTTLGRRQPGDAVNLEVDVIAKHVEKLVSAYTRPDPTPRQEPGS